MSSGSESSEESIDPGPIPARLGNWWLGDTLGAGYSGSIFKAHNIHNTSQIVALKVQYINHECPTNLYERGLFPHLRGALGFPTLYGDGVDGYWDYLAMELLGSSLDSLYKKMGKNIMDLKSVCVIGIQLLTRLECMHNRGVLHRDIQLGNCVIGLPPHEKTIYMIDFGFSKLYIDPKTKRHIPDSKAKRDFIGNYWFSSVGVHCRGKVPSRRDDIEALALMLIHLLTPHGLPWTRHGVPKTDSAHDRLKKEKKKATADDLVPDGGSIPGEFGDMLAYCRQLKFLDQPDYDRWRNILREVMRDNDQVAPALHGEEQFVWPPDQTTPVPRMIAPPAPARKTDEDMAEVINDLANLQVDPKIPDFNQQFKANATKSIRAAQTDSNPLRALNSHEIISISSGTDSSAGKRPTQTRLPSSKKAQQLQQLCVHANAVTDNTALATVIIEFVDLLKGFGQSGKNLTKEGLGFFDVVYGRLADPSVYVVPKKTSRSGGNRLVSGESLDAKEKLGVVARLKRDVASAKSNRELGQMVKDFEDVTNQSGRPTLTKDGFAFLQGVAERLIELDRV